MVYHDPRAAHGRSRDTTGYDEIDFAPRGEPSQIEERDYPCVLMWGVEKEYDDGVTWRLKLGITLDDGTMGHWWVGIKQAHTERWDNMLEVLDPSLLDPNSDPRPNLKPSEFKGAEFVVRAGYGNNGSGPWAQAFFPMEGDAPPPRQERQRPQQEYHGYGRPPAGHPAAQRQQGQGQRQQAQRPQQGQQRQQPQGQGQQQRSYGAQPRQAPRQQQQPPPRQSYARQQPQAQQEPPAQDNYAPDDGDLPF